MVGDLKVVTWNNYAVIHNFVIVLCWYEENLYLLWDALWHYMSVARCTHVVRLLYDPISNFHHISCFVRVKHTTYLWVLILQNFIWASEDLNCIALAILSECLFQHSFKLTWAEGSSELLSQRAVVRLSSSVVVVVVRKLSHFQLLLQTRSMDFDETW